MVITEKGAARDGDGDSVGGAVDLRRRGKNQRERGWGRDEAFRFRRTEANGRGVCRRGTKISFLK